MSPFTHTLLYCALLLLTLKELTEACTCANLHPQEHFCNSDVVVRATAMGENSASSPGHNDIQYKIKVNKVFKGDKLTIYLQEVRTSSESAACGISLETSKEYLLGGNMIEGKVHIYSCGLYNLWENLSAFQKKSLSQPNEGYQQGCQCKIRFCTPETCDSKAPDECVWSDRQETENLYKEHACLKQKDGSCSWQPSIPGKSTHNSHP
ncbi:metalloproteinase inhibitor 2-like [Bufo gargarizans]|uniref:metalloproteinase inhibitor 2-like n=1 Tax=Bufo gargarizans TaxID=30331 RepID=UPI001CF2969D|nr:metalloproteinase inhibitor 2-like [Bufo gargarizans]